ncbi:hypothetical protein A0H81_11429 [Grifola frondosa]|uniref:Integrase core domain-containing protein n=1 Tax=Grifola frondosa TaxID=5627 RepID=A0A1C7M006_GRIFR|nr:hypothetical protein A0H81_11429 [Grifola frondosa]
MPQDVADQLVLNKMSDLNDQAGRWGVQRTMDALAKDGTPVPRRIIREVMHDNEPDAVNARFPGKKKIPCAKLSSIGPFHEVNCDGHDKLGIFALQMGPVTLPIYGMKDKWSDVMLHLVVIPNNRNAVVVGHVFLDFVEIFGSVPIQITVDKGSETGNMFAFQTALRQIFAPELDVDAVPSFVALPSTRNIPIEGAWHWFREQTGRTLFHHVTQGKMLNIFNPNNEVHIKLFNWIWPPIIQQELDKFRDSWNMHTVRKQRNKVMPSGSTPTMFFTSPEMWGGKRVSVPVPKIAVNALRETLPITREEAFRFVDDEFAAFANGVFEELGKPIIDVGTAWLVFERMALILCEQLL